MSNGRLKSDKRYAVKLLELLACLDNQDRLLWAARVLASLRQTPTRNPGGGSPFFSLSSYAPPFTHFLWVMVHLPSVSKSYQLRPHARVPAPQLLRILSPQPLPPNHQKEYLLKAPDYFFQSCQDSSSFRTPLPDTSDVHYFTQPEDSR